MNINLYPPHRLEVWFRSSAPPGVSRSEHLRQLIRERGEKPDEAVCPIDESGDDPVPMTVRLDAETERILTSASSYLGMTRLAYCRWLMRHAGLSVCIGLDPQTMNKLRKISGGNVESFVRDLIASATKDVPDEESPTTSL